MNDAITVFQVGDLANEMRRLMEMSYPQIWIEGELSSLSTPASGHKYFTLKDENAQLRCAMFRARASINHYKLKEGDLVRVRAKISVYPARGDLQCIVQYVEEAGEGLLKRRFDELKEKLSQSGLFDATHKLGIPTFAKHIALVTSPTGAAVKDVLTTLKRRCPGIPVTIYPAVVQGESAAQSIIAALNNALNHGKADVLVLTRGGGSLEDLWCFNDEALANAIFNSPLPIISAVGHEVDFTISDLVADYRAPTPTAAAEILSPDRRHLINKINGLAKRIQLNYSRLLQHRAQQIDLSFKQLVHPRQQLEYNGQRLNQLSQRLQRVTKQSEKQKKSQLSNVQGNFLRNSPVKIVSRYSESLLRSSRGLAYFQQHNLKSLTQQFQSLGEQLDLISPLATMKRGFSIIKDKNNNIVNHAQQVKAEQTLSVTLATGQFNCTVDSVDLESSLNGKS